MVSKYKIKYRSQKWDHLSNGWHLYSRQFKWCRNGRQGFRRRRIAGPFKTKKEVQAQAGMLALRFNEMKEKVKKYPVKCPKTGRSTNKTICVNCTRKNCIWAGRVGRRGK